MTYSKKVSVCMAVYNGEKFIRQQIESVLKQLQNDDELLVFDDLSTDATAKIVTEFENDIRVKFKKNPNKLGVVKNFERALDAATGDYIFLCDQDDIWLPGKVAECVSALQKHLLVVTDCIVVDQNLKERHASFFELRHSGEGIVKNIWKNTYLGCCMAFRRELLSFCLPIPARIPMHDMWFGLLAETQGSVLFMPERLSLYRRHQLTASPTADKSNLSISRKLNVRAVLIICLVHRVLLLEVRKILKSIQS
jgi:glycosyltransferase involved in cell wall biosynthesis